MALRNGITLLHADKVAERLKVLSKRLPNRMGATMEAMGRLVIEESVSRTPEDTGELKASSYVNAPKHSLSGRYVTVEIGYGADGLAEEYALVQHENEYYNHKVGEAKFLLKAVNWFIQTGRKDLIAMLRSELIDMIGEY